MTKFSKINVINNKQTINLNLPQPNVWVSYLLLIIAGALLALAFAPFNYSLIAVLSLSIFAYLILLNANSAFKLGLIFGMSYFGVGVSWVAVSMHNFGNMSWLLTGVATFLWVLVMAVFPAATAYFAHKITAKLRLSNNWFLIFILPTCWLGFEWLRSWILTGFPWLLIGASQITSPFNGFMPIVGELGVSFIVLVFAGSVVIAAVSAIIKTKIISMLLIAGLWITASFLQPIIWTEPTGKALNIALIQGNISMSEKWQSKSLFKILSKYSTKTQELMANHKLDLVVWPEAAIPAYYSQIKPYLPNYFSNNTDLITGVIYDKTANKYFNSLLQLNDNKHKFYHKRHLVPFGEYTPLANNMVGWLMNNLSIPMSNLLPGVGGNNILSVNNTKIAPSICYEIIFSNLIRKTANQANLLLTVSNDAWFGDSWAPEQHLQIAQVRARENGKPLVRATNNGVTAFVTVLGAVQSRLSSNIAGTLIHRVATYQGSTFYGIYGIMPLVFGLILIFIWLIYARFKAST